MTAGFLGRIVDEPEVSDEKDEFLRMLGGWKPMLLMLCYFQF
jgi:hypothetical protein